MATIPGDSQSTVTINTTFMQDYDAAKPLYPDPGGHDWNSSLGACVDANGATHVFAGTSVNGPAIWHAFPDPGSLTGWRAETLATSGGPVATTDGLFVYGDVLRAARFNPDGTLGGLAELGPCDFPLDWDDRYCLEMQDNGGFWVRDLDSGVRVPLNFDPALQNPRPMMVPGGTQNGLLRLVVPTDADNDQSTWLPGVATLRADQSAFDFVADGQPVLAAIPRDDSVFLFAHGPGDVELFHSPGLDQPFQQPIPVQTFRGRFDAGGSGPIQWDAAADGALPGTAPLIGTWGFADPQGDAIQLFWRYNGQRGLWQSARDNAAADWDEPAIVDDIRIFAPLPGDNPAFLAVRLVNMLPQPEIWRRNSAGDYDVDIVELEGNPGSPVAVPSYRVELGFAQSGAPLAGADVTITPSVQTRATVNGERTTLSALKPGTYQTDENGTIWVMIAVDERLSAPKLSVVCPAAGAAFEVEVDKAMRTILTNLTADQMAAATDPLTSPPTPVLKDPSTAADCAGAINAAMKAVNALHADSRQAATGGPPGWRLAGSGAARWTAPGGAPTPAAAERLAGLDAWCVETIDGRMRFRTLDPAEAAARSAALAALPAWPQPESWFDDLIDGVGDLARAAWDGAVSIASISFSGATMLIHVITDAGEQVYNFVIDSLARAWDAVSFVLNAFASGLGHFYGWMLKQFGFLIDWDAVTAKRDAIKAMIRSGLAALPGNVEDPNLAAQQVLAEIGTWKAAFDSWIAQFRTTPLDKSSFSQQASSALQPLTGLLTANSQVAAQVSWLLEKAYGAVAGELGFPAGPSIAGLDTATAALAQAVDAAIVPIAPSFADLETLFDGWFGDAQIFTGATFDPLLTILQNHVDAFLDGLGTVTSAGGNVLHLLWANADAVGGWLDTPIELPFFSAFYEALTDGTFSPLDLVCLAAAIPATMFEDSAEMDPKDPYWIAGLCLAGIGALVKGPAQYEMAMSPTKDAGTLGYVGLACKVGLGICLILHATSRKQQEYIFLGVATLVPIVPTAIFKTAWKRRGTLKGFASVLMLFYSLVSMIKVGGMLEAYGLLQITSNLAEAFVEQYPEPLNEKAAEVYGVVQAVLEVTSTALYYSATAAAAEARAEAPAAVPLPA